MSAGDHLSPQQFTARYRPGLYSDTWSRVAKHPDFVAGGDAGWDLDDLTDHIAAHGMQEAVQVENGEVSEGHHRVVAALRANKPVRYQEW